MIEGLSLQFFPEFDGAILAHRAGYLPFYLEFEGGGGTPPQKGQKQRF